MDLLITADFPPIEGGISSVSLSLSRKLYNNNHEFIVMAPEFSHMEEFDRNEGYQVIRVPGYDWRWGRIIPLAYSQGNWIKENRIRINRILAMNFSFGGLWGLYVKKRYKIPYRIFAYGFEFLRFSDNPVMKKIILRIYKEADKIYAISEFTKESLIRFGVVPHKIDVMQIAVDPSQFQKDRLEARQKLFPYIGDSPLLLTVGRLISRKGHDTVLKAMSILRNSHPDIHYAVVGRGPEESNLKNMVNNLGFQKRVHFAGYIPDEELGNWYSASDILIMPAKNVKGSIEGYGLVFLEAGAAGIPVIGSSSGGIPEAVIKDETGLLVTPGNHEELAVAISKLLDNPELGKDMGNKGKIRAEQLWEVFGSDILAY